MIALKHMHLGYGRIGNMLSFFEFNLLLENTVAQVLRQLSQDKIKKEIIKFAKKDLLEALYSHRERMGSEQLMDRILNWTVYQWFFKPSSFLGKPGGQELSDEIIKDYGIIPDHQVSSLLPKFLEPYRTRRQFNSLWDNFTRVLSNIDFVASQGNQLISKFNNPDYTLQDFNLDSQQWHEALAKKKRGKGAQGRTILEMGNYKWVSLDRWSCEQEGRAGGHCGNVGGRPGDNILSLRDSKGKVHLTFVVNSGVLVEAKGAGNKRPAFKYHPYIAKLLKSGEVSYLNLGQRYLPKEDFHFSDLPPALRDSVLELNPNIDDEERLLRDRIRKHIIEKYDDNYTNHLMDMHRRGMTTEIESMDAAREGNRSIGTYLGTFKLGGLKTKKNNWYRVSSTGDIERVSHPVAAAQQKFIKQLKKTAPWIWENW
jgi:hypothetical protein